MDTFIPGLDVFSGFSICSSPTYFTDTGEIELAVQMSDHPPAYWVHTKVKTEFTAKHHVRSSVSSRGYCAGVSLSFANTNFIWI